MTHHLPRGGVPWVQGAPSPVSPLLLHFATSRSVHHLATMLAGAYPPSCLPNAWTPRLPPPPGPCYWLVASGTPTGWRGGCLVAGLVSSTVCYYCLGGSSALVVCARRSREVQGVGAGAGPRVSPLSPPFSPALFAVRVAGRPFRVPLPLACQYAIPCGLCVPRARSGCHSGPRRVPVGCVCVSASDGFRAPPRVGFAPPRAIPAQGAGRAVWSCSSPSAFPAPVPCSAYIAWWEVAPSLQPPPWVWGVCPLVGGPVLPGQSSFRGVWGGGGGTCRQHTRKPHGAHFGRAWTGARGHEPQQYGGAPSMP